MRSFKFLIVFFLALGLLHSTEEMAKKESKSCITCHKTARGGRPGNSMLSPRGFNYLKSIIQGEDYVPNQNYRQLGILASKIAENRRKRDGGGEPETPPVKAEEPTPEDSASPAQAPLEEEATASGDEAAPVPSETVPENPRPTPEPEVVRPEPVEEKIPGPAPSVKSQETEARETPPKSPVAEEAPAATGWAALTQKKVVTPVSVESSLVTSSSEIPGSPVQEVPAGDVMILHRDKPATVHLPIWFNDWEYDDYF